MSKLAKWLLAYMRWNKAAVCEMSAPRGLIDFHDYPDSGDGPLHFHTHKCQRCGKEFTI